MEVSQFGLAIFCVSALIHGIILGLTYDVFSAVAVGNGKVFEPDLKTRLHNVKLPLIGRFDFNFQKRNRSFQTIVLFICWSVLCFGRMKVSLRQTQSA